MVETTRGGQWSAMEKELHAKFKAVRAIGKPVGQRRFLREGKKVFQQLYPDQVHIDENGHFSPGWFTGFQRRWHISWQIRTKASPEQKVPAIYIYKGFCKKCVANHSLMILAFSAMFHLQYGSNPNSI